MIFTTKNFPASNSFRHFQKCNKFLNFCLMKIWKFLFKFKEVIVKHSIINLFPNQENQISKNIVDLYLFKFLHKVRFHDWKDHWNIPFILIYYRKNRYQAETPINIPLKIRIGKIKGRKVNLREFRVFNSL